MPSCLRYFVKSSSFGKADFLASVKAFSFSLAETLRPWSLASPATHFSRIRNCSTWLRRPSYSCLQRSLYCAGVVAGWPFAGFGAVFVFLATHAAYFGGL